MTLGKSSDGAGDASAQITARMAATPPATTVEGFTLHDLTAPNRVLGK